jgi:hypothetical protein
LEAHSFQGWAEKQLGSLSARENNTEMGHKEAQFLPIPIDSWKRLHCNVYLKI